MTSIDWVILIFYLIFIVSMSAVIGKRQKSQEDYYLGGRSMPSWQIAFSVMATQVSAISLIGVPAFIALKSGGGLIWLQYEFAIPLAMMLIMLILVPMYHATRAVTIYEYLEKRFGTQTRTIISAVFLISRGLGTGVALLATGTLEPHSAGCCVGKRSTTFSAGSMLGSSALATGELLKDWNAESVLANLWRTDVRLAGAGLLVVDRIQQRV